jgi:hypothetical protein
MANPFTATFLAIAGGGLQALGSISDMNAEVGSLRAQSRAEAQNARVLDAKAQTVGQETARNEEQLRRQYRDFAGKQASAIAESGIANSGSVLDVVRDSETRAEYDALKMRFQGTSEAKDLRYQAGAARMRSQLARDLAKRRQVTGFLDVASAGVSTATSIYNRPKK